MHVCVHVYAYVCCFYNCNMYIYIYTYIHFPPFFSVDFFFRSLTLTIGYSEATLGNKYCHRLARVSSARWAARKLWLGE